MKKFKFIVLSFLCVIFCFTLSACIFPWVNWVNKQYYYDYHVLWYCDDPYIILGDKNYGFMELDGKNYMLDIAWAPHGSAIYFFDEDKIESGLRDDFLIWEADTEIKEGRLFLTIVKDNVSDFEGKTLILNQRPIEDDF